MTNRVVLCFPLLLLINISAVFARFPDALLKLQHSLALKKDELSETGYPIHHEASVNLTRRTLTRFANREVDRESRCISLHCLPLVISTAEFHVNGTSIPHVNFDVGDSWAGLLPISPDPHETRKV